MSFISLLVIASARALPPATALPPPNDDTTAVLAPINAAFAAFEAGDAAAMLRHVYPDGRVTAVGTLPSGSGLRQQSWAQFAERLKPGQGFQERISDLAIESTATLQWSGLRSLCASAARSPIADTIISTWSVKTELGRS